jgi:dienelactone hydrolase
MRIRRMVVLLEAVLAATLAFGQADTGLVSNLLNVQLQSVDVADFQMRHYIMQKAAPLPRPSSASEWKSEAQKLRKHLINDVYLHGWPQEWVDEPPKFEDMGVIPSGEGYRVRKFRYEIVPGFQSTALLYEPATVTGKAPAILNVSGHYGALGHSSEWEQKRCINFAKMGIYALNLEWIGQGELFLPQDQHWFAAHIELVGADAAGLFYLAAKRGLDYLDQLPNVDHSRLGMTGLSGGGWQTMMLSGLDERILVSVPVAGWSVLKSSLERDIEVGCMEYKASDVLVSADADTFVALHAPRPTLLINNANDIDFPAPLEKPILYDPLKFFFGLYGHADNLEWHENEDPADHNYQLDNRLAAYRFFAKHFGLDPVKSEIPVDAEIKTFDELAVGLPQDNLTVLGVAKKLAERIVRPPVPEDEKARDAWRQSQRAKLRDVVHYQNAEIDRVWAFTNTKRHEVEAHSQRFDFTNGLSASGVWLKAIAIPENAPATLVLNDEGLKSSAGEVSDRLNRGEQILAANLLSFVPDQSHTGFLPAAFLGQNQPHMLAAMLASVGDRPLGLQVAQLIALAHWLQKRSGSSPIRLESSGIRSSVVALTAAALEPRLFAEVRLRHGIPSLRDLLDKPVDYQSAPELFCLDFFKEFDIDRLTQIAATTKIVMDSKVK